MYVVPLSLSGSDHATLSYHSYLCDTYAEHWIVFEPYGSTTWKQLLKGRAQDPGSRLTCINVHWDTSMWLYDPLPGTVCCDQASPRLVPKKISTHHCEDFIPWETEFGSSRILQSFCVGHFAIIANNGSIIWCRSIACIYTLVTCHIGVIGAIWLTNYIHVFLSICRNKFVMMVFYLTGRWRAWFPQACLGLYFVNRCIYIFLVALVRPK